MKTFHWKRIHAALMPLALAAACLQAAQIDKAAETPDQPNPMLLLKGVESARLQIPPSVLRMNATYQSAQITNVGTIIASFDGVQRLIETRRGNRRAKCSFDGAAFYHQSSSIGPVTIRDSTSTTPDYAFDLRILGIGTAYYWEESVEKRLKPRAPTELALIGREIVHGRSAWHVRFVDSFDQKTELWIDDTDGYKVYRFDFETPHGTKDTSLSFYENRKYPWLPSRIEATSYSPNGTVSDTRVISVLEATVNERFPKETWTVAGLKAFPGTPIVDARTKQPWKQVGYWDGKGVRKDRP